MSMFGDRSDTMSLSDAIKSSANQLLFRTLLQNPEKRAKVLELLTQEGIVGPDENSCPNQYLSPIKRLQKNERSLHRSPKTKNNNVRLESPSAIARRRALQRLESSSSEETSQKTLPKLPSPPFVGKAQPYDQILKGVVAYCEIRSNGEDRSAAIKTVMQSMGARVKDNLCTGVTHVILKDGLYTTYRKAKMMKIHVVSVLWLEAVRKHKFRVPEAKFPAVCADAYDANLTKICQEMQKDYDEVIQDELNKTKEPDSRRSEASLDLVTVRNKWRSTIYGTNFKDPHNRTEIASPYKYIDTNPELSESDSYVSVGSNDVVPSSQPVHRTPSPEPEPDLPESYLANARNSFELDKASKIRSPESIMNEMHKKDMKKISLDPEDSLRLHITTTDESNLNNTEKSRNSSPKNNLEDISTNKKSSSTDEFHLRISEETNLKSGPSSTLSSSSSNISTNKTRRRTVGLKRSKKPIQSSNDPLVTPNRKTHIESDSNNESKISRRKTLGNILTEENVAKNVEENEKNNKNLNTPRIRRKTMAAKLQEVENIVGEENEDVIQNTEENSIDLIQDDNVKKTRTKNIMNTSIKPTEIEDNMNNISVRKSRRKTLAVTYKENVLSSEKSSNSNDKIEDSLEKELRQIVGENENIEDNLKSINVRKTRRKTLAVSYKENDLSQENSSEKTEDSLEKEIQQPIEENEDPSVNLNENNKRKTRRKTLANITKEPEDVQNTTLNSVRKSRRKTIAQPFKDDEQSEEKSATEDENKRPKENITTRKTKKVVIAPEQNQFQTPSKEKSSDSSAEKSRPRVRKLYDPNQKVSLSQINWETEQAPETKTPTCSPPKKGRYKVPLVNIPILLSEKAKKKVKSAVKQPKSVPPKIQVQETKKRKSVKALTFSSTSSETDTEKPKITTPARKSERIAKTPKKNFKIPSTSDLDSPKTPKKTQPLQLLSEEKRRSTLDFVPQRSKKSLDESRLTQKQKVPFKLPSIVCTRFHKSDVQIFQQIVKKLGGFVVEDEVSKRTTHLVAGGPARTINLLRAIARGCWILRAEWLYKSLENGKWLEEEDFEMTEFSPAVQKCRLEKQSFGPLYSMDIFTSCGPVFVSRGSTPRFSDLEELLELCGGRVVRFAKDAQVVVGEQASQEGITCVSEKWILDSITHNKMRKLKSYILQTRESPIL